MSYLCLILTFTFQIMKVYCIINGIKTQNSEFPSIVLLKFNDSFYCGASIILPKFVLTSGVCGFNKDRLEGVGIRFVDLFKPEEGRIIAFNDIVVHPQFKMGNTTAIFDIAIVVLQEEIEFSSTLTAIPIYEKPIVPGLSCQTAGWGMLNDKLLTEENVEKPWGEENILRKSVQLIVEMDLCSKLIDEHDYMKLSNDTHVCARGQEIKQGPSFGDFGGPLVCDGQQAAISTHSLYDRKTEYLYTVYTPIFKNEKWISEVVGNTRFDKRIQSEAGDRVHPVPDSENQKPPSRYGAFRETNNRFTPVFRGSVISCYINNYLILFLLYVVRF